MTSEPEMIRTSLRTPRAAAVAGIIFSVLLSTSLILIRLAVPANPREQGAWLATNWRGVSLALQLLPFSGIAFLWFVGVVRDRMGDREDRFFATVFLGSGLLFLAMMFASAAVAGGILAVYTGPEAGAGLSDTYAFGRAVTYVTMYTYAMKMAGVFMMSTCTVFLRTQVTPRWMAYLGYILALLLIVSVGYIGLAVLVFPLWVLLVSVYILIENYRQAPDASGSQE